MSTLAQLSAWYGMHFYHMLPTKISTSSYLKCYVNKTSN